MIIYFFTKRIEPRLDFGKLLDDFFVNIPNTTISSNDEICDIKIKEPAFNFEYHFFITKRNRLNNIQALSREYYNTNLFIELPILAPSYLIRRILKVIDNMVKEFNLSIFYQSLNDVCEFNAIEVLADLGFEKNNYVLNHPDNYRFIDQQVLSTVCSYDQIMNTIVESIKVEALAKPYEIKYDTVTEKVALCIEWVSGTPLLFPPYLDYVYVVEEGNLLSVIPFETFFKYSKKLMHEVCKNKNFNLQLDMDLYFLNEKNARKCSKLIKKMRKDVVLTSRFEEISLNQLIEK